MENKIEMQKGKGYLVVDYSTYNHTIIEIQVLEVSKDYYKIKFTNYIEWKSKTDFSDKEQFARTYKYLIVDTLS